MSHFFNKIRPFIQLTKPVLKIPRASINVRRQPYVPPPDSDPKLVREEAVLKSIVLHDKTYPIRLSRLQEIADSPTGWVSRTIPPPDLPFEMKRNKRHRFDIDIHRKGRRKQTYTIIKNVHGDIRELEKCLKWRLGDGYYMVLEKYNKIVLGGFHKRSITTLLQALGF